MATFIRPSFILLLLQEIIIKREPKEKANKEKESAPPAAATGVSQKRQGHVAQLANKLGKGGGIRMGPPAPGVIKRGGQLQPFPTT